MDDGLRIARHVDALVASLMRDTARLPSVPVILQPFDGDARVLQRALAQAESRFEPRGQQDWVTWFNAFAPAVLLKASPDASLRSLRGAVAAVLPLANRPAPFHLLNAMEQVVDGLVQMEQGKRAHSAWLELCGRYPQLIEHHIVVCLDANQVGWAEEAFQRLVLQPTDEALYAGLTRLSEHPRRSASTRISSAIAFFQPIAAHLTRGYRLGTKMRPDDFRALFESFTRAVGGDESRRQALADMAILALEYLRDAHGPSRAAIAQEISALCVAGRYKYAYELARLMESTGGSPFEFGGVTPTQFVERKEASDRRASRPDKL